MTRNGMMVGRCTMASHRSIIVGLFVFVCAPSYLSGQSKITWQAADGAGAVVSTSPSAGSILQSSTGQPSVGISTGSGRILYSGFLAVRLVPTGAARILAQPALDFGSVIIGGSSSLPLTVQNTGSQPLIVASTAIAPAVFSVTGGGAQTIPAGGSIALNVTYTPVAAGTATGTLTIASNAANDPSFRVSLTGTGVTSAPKIQFDVTRLDFDSVKIGSFKAKRVTITNGGNAALQILGQTVGGTHAADFVITHASSASVASGANDYVEIRFAPRALGVRTASLAITCNDANKPVTNVSLVGTGANVVGLESMPDHLDGITMLQNHPNPFAASTVIEYAVSIPGSVSLSVSDGLGRRVARLENVSSEAGAFSVRWAAEGLPSGTYQVELRHIDAHRTIRSRRILMQLTR